MAGSEKTGYENATDHLLENAYYIANTHRPLVSKTDADRIVAVAKLIGSIPIVLDYHEHDRIVAAISHLPHLIASSPGKPGEGFRHSRRAHEASGCRRF